jgi:hypothetical protein
MFAAHWYAEAVYNRNKTFLPHMQQRVAELHTMLGAAGALLMATQQSHQRRGRG